MNIFPFAKKSETASSSSGVAIVPRPQASNSVQTRPYSAPVNSAVSRMLNNPGNHVRLIGIFGYDSVVYPEVTWKQLEQKASPKQICHLKILQCNYSEPKSMDNNNAFDSFKSVISEAWEIEWIEVVLKKEPPSATNRQRCVALAVCQAAYEDDKNCAPTVSTTMSEVGVDVLHKGTAHDFSTEYIVAECHKHNEVYVGFRGTTRLDEWLGNATAFVTQELTLGGVHAGFYQHMQIFDHNFLYNLLNRGKSVILCGHSLGAAAAAIRLISMLPRLHQSKQILTGKIRVIGFGAPLFATNVCAEYVTQTFNCRNLFDFTVNSGDPVPGLLADLSCLVEQGMNIRNKSSNIALALDIARHVSPSMMAVFDQWFNTNQKKLKEALRGVEPMYVPLGTFHFVCSRSRAESVHDPDEIVKRLKGFELNPRTLVKHQINVYVADVEPFFNNSIIKKAKGEIASLNNSTVGSYDIELGDRALWIKINDCPLYISEVVLTATGQQEYSFKIEDAHRNEVEYGPIEDGEGAVTCGAVSISKKPAKMPRLISKMTLKLPVTPRERESIREILKNESAMIKFKTTIGGSPEPLSACVCRGDNSGQDALLIDDVSRIYHGVLLSALLEVVYNRTPTARNILYRKEPISLLLQVSESVKQILGQKYHVETSVGMFLREMMQSSTKDEELKTALEKAEKVASEEIRALRCVFAQEILFETILTKGDTLKGVAGAVVIAFVVAGCIVGAAAVTGIGVVAVPAGAALTEGGICTVTGGALLAGGSSLYAFLRSDEVGGTLYIEKLKLILKMYNQPLPTQLTSTELETSLQHLMQSGLKGPKYNGRPLKPESEKMMVTLAHGFANLKGIREYAEQRTMVALVGVKNVGKSTAGEILFGKYMHGGVNQSTEYPQPYSWESVGRKATVIDFPGATEAKDETLELARKYLSIGGASAWCLVFINPFFMGTADCKLMRDITDRFHPSRVRVVCTHGDARDTNMKFKVDEFKDEISGTTGVNGVKKYVVDMFDGPKIGIDTDKVIVCSFQSGQGELPNGVLGKEEARLILLGQIWPI